MTESLIGAGIAFPMRLDPTGAVALVTRSQELEESIYLILATVPGERPMRPEFGCGIHNYVFAPSNSDTAGRLTFEVRSALDRWEPRIDLLKVLVTPEDRSGSGCMVIDIDYAVRGTNDSRNLVFPFYVIPEDPS